MIDISNTYSYDGKLINRADSFAENAVISHYYDEDSETAYSLIRVFKKKIDGTYQYPFVRACFRTENMSVLNLVEQEKWVFAVNGSSNKQYTIENSVNVGNGNVPTRVPLTIDSNGELGYLTNISDGSSVPTGIVSALVGWCPIIVDYQDETQYDPIDLTGNDDVIYIHAQRQIIGQFANGDYAFITSEGRTFDNSQGFTFAEARAVCKKHNLKFAYMLDGGGSVQTVFGKKNVNLIYENETGRPIWNAIVFNGTTSFSF